MIKTDKEKTKRQHWSCNTEPILVKLNVYHILFVFYIKLFGLFWYHLKQKEIHFLIGLIIFSATIVWMDYLDVKTKIFSKFYPL